MELWLKKIVISFPTDIIRLATYLSFLKIHLKDCQFVEITSNNAGKYAGRFKTCPYGWISQQLRITHYAQWIFPMDGFSQQLRIIIMHNGFPNGWIAPTITNYALCTMDFPMDGSPNNYELYIMHNGFPQWMDYPNNYELCIMHYELYCGRI